jgi:hypothetical protein
MRRGTTDLCCCQRRRRGSLPSAPRRYLLTSSFEQNAAENCLVCAGEHIGLAFLRGFDVPKSLRTASTFGWRASDASSFSQATVSS